MTASKFVTLVNGNSLDPFHESFKFTAEAGYHPIAVTRDSIRNRHVCLSSSS